MKHLLAYKQSKEVTEGLLPNASHTFCSLVEQFQEADNAFTVLIDEKAQLDKTKDVRISAASLYDAYELIESCMVELVILINKIGMEEVNGLFSYKDINEFVNPSRVLFPHVLEMIAQVTNQFSDFIRVGSRFNYTGIDSMNVNNIRSFMGVHDKISAISTLIYEQITLEHESLIASINYISADLEHNGMVYESVQSVSAMYYAALIPNVAIIEVGETAKEAQRKGLAYVGNDKESGMTVMPCSKGVYYNVQNGNSIDSWTEVDGVITLPEESERYSELKESSSLIKV